MKILFFDTETTGINHQVNEIVQFSALVEIDGEVTDQINVMIQPTKWDNIDKGALETTGMTIDQLKTFEEPAVAFRKIEQFFQKHIDKYNKNDKFYPAGHNVSFDLDFLQSFWRQYDRYGTGTYQNWRAIDTRTITNFMIMAKMMTDLPDTKLSTLCDHFGIEIKAHDAMSDIIATRELLKRYEAMANIKPEYLVNQEPF